MSSFHEYLISGQAWLYLPAAVLLGALHALEPGHSKTMMAAFIVAVRGTVGQAVLLGLAATVSHTAIIWILAFIGLHYSGRFDVETTEPYFQLSAGLIVIAMAVWMFTRVRGEQRAAEHHHHEVGHGHHGPHGGPILDLGRSETVELSIFEMNVPPHFRLYFFDQNGQLLGPPAPGDIHLETIRADGVEQKFQFVLREDYLQSTSDIPEPHEFEVVFKRSGITYYTKFIENHQHHHSHEDTSGEFEDEHARQHAREWQARFPTRQVTTGQLILFGLTGGLMPCPAAFAVLLVCLQIKQFTLGFALVLAFSLGLAITLVSVGALAALSVREASRRFSGFGQLAHKLPYASVGLMALIGIVVASQGLRHLIH